MLMHCTKSLSQSPSMTTRPSVHCPGNSIMHMTGRNLYWAFSKKPVLSGVHHRNCAYRCLVFESGFCNTIARTCATGSDATTTYVQEFGREEFSQTVLSAKSVLQFHCWGPRGRRRHWTALRIELRPEMEAQEIRKTSERTRTSLCQE